MGYLDRSCVGSAQRPTMSAMTALGRLRRASNAQFVEVAISDDGMIYASTGSAAFDKAVQRGGLEYVGRYLATASVGDVASDIEFVWNMLDKPQPSVILATE